jgi:hypothetical protein
MDMKGQSALEYLMTYGWALIVIAIVIGVLIFVTSSSTGGVTCQSQSSGLIVETAAINAGTDGAGIVLRNATGKDITYTAAISAGDFADDINGGLSETVQKNATFVIKGVSGPTAGTTFDDGQIIVSYTIQGLDANGTILCAGTV